jgi:hypothetical protein
LRLLLTFKRDDMQVIRPHQWRDKCDFKLARPCCE